MPPAGEGTKNPRARRARFGVVAAVYPHSKKYFRFLPAQITGISASSRPTGGAYRDRHGRGMRCGGRGCAPDERH
jgi:hypothetical protein